MLSCKFYILILKMKKITSSIYCDKNAIDAYIIPRGNDPASFKWTPIGLANSWV